MAFLPKKSFNVSGPCRPDEHYMLRLLPFHAKVGRLMERRAAFTVEGPARSGRSTYLMNLAERVNRDGKRYAVHCPLGHLKHAARLERGLSGIAAAIDGGLKASSSPALRGLAGLHHTAMKSGPRDMRLLLYLSHLAGRLDRELAVFFDDPGLMPGPVLHSFLSQLAAGAAARDGGEAMGFPVSFAFAGLAAPGGRPAAPGAEAGQAGLRVADDPLTLPPLGGNDIRALFLQHQEATGQPIDGSAVERALYWSGGNPWLVNVLGDSVARSAATHDRAWDFDGAGVDRAARELILKGESRFGHVLALLSDARFRVPVDYILADPEGLPGRFSADELELCVRAGLLKKTGNGEAGWLPANPVYVGIIERALDPVRRRRRP